MMRIARIMFAAALAALTVSCNREPLPGAGSLELSSIEAGMPSTVSTKATNYSTYVGRGVVNANSRYLDFVNGDEIVITRMARTADPVAAFSYTGFGYVKADGVWSRTQGGAGKLYWSDSVHDHTFIGYSKPAASFPFMTSDAEPGPTSVYSGSIAYTPADPPAHNLADLSDNDKIKSQDILLLYNTQQRAGDAGEATLVFHHGLASVRVMIDIVDYSSQQLDRRVKVSNLVLSNMPVEYTWDQNSSGVKVKTGSVVADFKAWHPDASVNTFYTIAVPGTTDMVMTFDVTTPDPLYPDDATKVITKPYSASCADVTLHAGKCTTLSVHMNHNGENITIGASYQDWEFVDTPDVGTLKKNVTFIDKSNLDVTIAGDEHATAEDATWLYYVSDNTVMDIYGNDGTEAKPFKIATANQLISFANEVAAGRDFYGQYVMLDASLTLQEIKATADSYYPWTMIGAAGKPFQGTFIGGGRTISKIYGNPLFFELGTSAHIESLVLLECLTTGKALANTNAGTVCALRVEGKATAAVESNSGLIYASSIVSTTSADGCHLVTSANTGKIRASFSAGTSKGYMYAGAGAVNESVEATIAESEAMDKKDMITESFVTTMNDAITAARANDSSLDNHSFTVVAGSYPVVQ